MKLSGLISQNAFSKKIVTEAEDVTERVFEKEITILGDSAFKIAGIIKKRKTGWTGYIVHHYKGTIPASGFRAQDSEIDSYGDTIWKTQGPIEDKSECINLLNKAVKSIKVK
jgi:hypothetical protein